MAITQNRGKKKKSKLVIRQENETSVAEKDYQFVKENLPFLFTQNRGKKKKSEQKFHTKVEVSVLEKDLQFSIDHYPDYSACPYGGRCPHGGGELKNCPHVVFRPMKEV